MIQPLPPRLPRGFSRPAAALLAALLLAHCSAPVSVRTVEPPPPLAPVTGLSKTEAALQQVRQAGQRISQGDASAVADYNHWTGRLIEELGASGAEPWIKPVALAPASGTTVLRASVPAGWDPAGFQFTPADTLEFKGAYARYHQVTPGIGAPVVGVKSFEGIGRTTARAKQPLRNLTAVVRFSGTTATLDLLDPYQLESVPAFGGTRPLAADPAAAVMLGMSKARIDKLGLARLLAPGKYADTARLNFLQPYDSKRIPVLMVHGLDSTPATWAPLYFNLIEDPVIRKNYQFWVFSYPSGYPYPYSASLLRHELADVHKEFPNHKDMVIIGHSMGSLVSRLMVTDVGDKIWYKAFGKPPAETKISGSSRKLLEDSIIFTHNDRIDRAVFISGPHRGSELATNWVGRIGNKLVRLPGFMADVRDSMVSAVSADVAGLALNRAPSSIDTLSPTNPFVVEINKYPVAPGIPYHSIIGDRGRGDTPDSSDGVVAYWSSHLDGAASEKIVPSGHPAHQNTEGMEEVQRILLLHLKGKR